MATEITMPQLGESVVEGTITKWLKHEGDMVEADELLVEISTDKVDSEIPSSTSGRIQKLLVQEGDTVQVGTPIALLGDEAEAAGPQEQAAPPEPQAEEAPAPEAGARRAEDKEEAAAAVPTPAPDAQAREVFARERAEQGDGRGQGAEPQRAQPAPPPSRPAEETKTATPARAPDAGRPPGRPDDTSKRGIISPLVRRLAAEHGVDLDALQGTGTGGRIRKEDVLRFVEESAAPAGRPEQAPAEEPAAAAPAAAKPGEREELVPWSNIRRRTAEHMVASSLETARAWNAVEADWSNIVALRNRVKDGFKEKEGFNLTFMAFLGRVLCDSLLEMPHMNATFDEENQANRIKHYVNLGIAVALEGGGLIVPVIKRADEKNLVGMARAIIDIVNRARSKKLSPDDLAGGTFTITNPGPFGSVISVPIIPKGQTAIVGFEAIQKRVVVTDEDAIAIRSMGFLTLSWDHRIIDGAEAASFLSRLRERIESTDFSSELSQYM